MLARRFNKGVVQVARLPAVAQVEDLPAQAARLQVARLRGLAK